MLRNETCESFGVNDFSGKIISSPGDSSNMAHHRKNFFVKMLINVLKYHIKLSLVSLDEKWACGSKRRANIAKIKIHATPPLRNASQEIAPINLFSLLGIRVQLSYRRTFYERFHWSPIFPVTPTIFLYFSAKQWWCIFCWSRFCAFNSRIK